MTNKPKPSSVLARITGNVDDDDHHAERLIDHLKGATRFTCVVAFARKSGFDLIRGTVKERIAAGMFATFVVGIDFFQSEPELILDLLKLTKTAKKRDQVKIFMGAENAACTMHPKIYVFSGGGVTTAIVGSANMTWGGLAGNWEFSALIQGRDVDWEIAVNKWIQDRVEDGEILEANAKIVARYKIRRDVYLAHMKMAERRARRAADSSPGDLDTLTAILATMRADGSDNGFDVQVAQRASALPIGSAILERMTRLVTPTPEGFLAVYQELLEGIWHSGGLHRAKTTIAKKVDTFLGALRALADSDSKDPGVLYDLLLRFMQQVPKAGVNVITEVLHTRDATRFPVMNGNSVSGMRMAKILSYPEAPTKANVDGTVYARFCVDAEKIRKDLGLRNLSELDAVFNYAYWGTAKKVVTTSASEE